MKIFVDGKWLDKDQAKISVFDHGLLYGDGIFEGIRVYNGRVFCLHEHMDRLFNSAKGILLEIPYTMEEIEKTILQGVKMHNLHDAYIRLVVTRGFGDLGLDMRKCKRATVIVIVDKIALYPDTVYEQGLKVITSSLRRTPHVCLSPNIKSLNYLNNILAKNEAVRAGAQEAILLNIEGYVAECSGDNIFYLKKGVITTPPLWAGILPGVTRDVVLGLLKTHIRMPAKENLFTLIDLYHAEEVFVTGTGAEILGVVEIDGRKIGSGRPGKFTRQIQEAYRELTKNTGTPVYENTLTGA